MAEKDRTQMDDVERWKQERQRKEQQKQQESDEERRRRIYQAAEEAERPAGTGMFAAAGSVCALAALFWVSGPMRVILLICGLVCGVIGVTGKKKNRGLAAVCIGLTVYGLVSALPYYFIMGYLDQSQEAVNGTLANGEPAEEDFEAGTRPLETEPETTEETPAADVMDSLTAETIVTPRELLILFENHGDVPADIHGEVVFYGENGEMLSLEERWSDPCWPDGRAMLSVYLPHDEDFQFVPFDSYEIRLDAEEAEEDEASRYFGNELEIVSNVGTEGTVLASISNPTGQVFRMVQMICLYYKDGEAVGYVPCIINEVEEEAVAEFGRPTDEHYKTLEFDDYEILVMSTWRAWTQ